MRIYAKIATNKEVETPYSEEGDFGKWVGFTTYCVSIYLGPRGPFVSIKTSPQAHFRLVKMCQVMVPHPTHSTNCVVLFNGRPTFRLIHFRPILT